MMKYQLNEGTITLPELTEDRTFNIFNIQGIGQGENVNIVINRDVFEPGETLESYAERQLMLLERTLRSVQETARRDVSVGTSSLPGIELEAKSTDAATGRVQYQVQVMCHIHDAAVLIMTMTSPAPFSDKLRSDWATIIASFTPA